MPRADSEFAVRTQGLAKLNRDLGKIDKDLRRDSLRELREIGKKVRGTASSLARVGDAPKTPGVPKLAQSFRYSASNKGATIRSSAPHAGVFEYGGVIQPRGVPITIPKDRMVGRAIQKDARDIEEQIGDLLDGIARRNGFR